MRDEHERQALAHVRASRMDELTHDERALVHLYAQAMTELEAARAVVEAATALRNSGYDGPCMGDAVAPLFRAVTQHEDAAKAGKAVE